MYILLELSIVILYAHCLLITELKAEGSLETEQYPRQ